MKNHLVLKEKVLTHYSGGELRCVRCGFLDLRALSIDHIEGSGNWHRRKMRSSGQFYQWLIKNNFPPGYQTLCMNCQFIKRYENNEHYRSTASKEERAKFKFEAMMKQEKITLSPNGLLRFLDKENLFSFTSRDIARKLKLDGSPSKEAHLRMSLARLVKGGSITRVYAGEYKYIPDEIKLA